MRQHKALKGSAPTLPKARTGISGFDEITGGGVPRGRPTLVCGGPGCGKTLFALEFVIRGAIDFDEPGVIITFEENADDLKRNVASMGFDLESLVARKKIAIDYVRLERAEIEETGEYSLEGLFVRIAERFAIPLAEIPMIGDSHRDLEAGAAAGGRTILVRTGKGEATLARGPLPPGTLVFDDLAAAARHLVAQSPAEKKSA